MSEDQERALKELILRYVEVGSRNSKNDKKKKRDKYRKSSRRSGKLEENTRD